MSAMRLSLLLVLALASGGAGLSDSIAFPDGPPCGDIVGGHDLRRPARVIPPGSSTSFDLSVTPGRPITLELEELHDREEGLTAYAVYADDVRMSLRTWQGCGAGAVHYFVDLPARQARRMTVRIENIGTLPVCIGRAWAFVDFAEFFDAAAMAVTFAIAPTVKLQDEFEADLARVRQVAESLGDHPHVKPAWTTHLAHARWSDERIAARLDHVLRLAEAADMPVQICFDTWWGSTPNGPDGKGGFWTDVQYQQVVYDSTERRMTLSTPNRWSSVPWLTVNHPDLNAHKVSRLRSALVALRSRLTELAGRGKRHLVLAINLDNEPVYWASGSAGLGMHLLEADFNPHTVAAAKRDGVTLDPVDGLAREERAWLLKNLLDYHAQIAGAAVETLGRDAIIVRGSDVTPPRDLLRNNVYTQAMVANPRLQFPMRAVTTGLWESAAPASARVGGEWNRDSLAEQQAVMRMLPLGRNAAVNAECGDDPAEMLGVRIGYALGQRYYTPYNYPLDRMDVATADLRDSAAPFPLFVHQRTVLEHDFASDAWKAIVTDHGGVEVGPLGHTQALGVRPVSNTAAGFLAYRVTVPRDGLSLELCGRAFDFTKPNEAVAIRILVDGVEAGTLRGRDLHAVTRFDLTALAQGKTSVEVRIELHPAGIAMREWCSLWLVRFTEPWPPGLTQGLPPQDRSLENVRRQSLLVSWRRDAELAIAAAGASPRADAAREAYDRGRYADAYAIANEASAAELPATFCVIESGDLSPHPLRVACDGPVTVELLECAPDRVRLRAMGAAARVVARLSPQKRYIITHDRPRDEWCITPAADNGAASAEGTVSDAEGRISLAIAASPPAAHAPEPGPASRPALQRVSGIITDLRQLTPYEMPSLALDVDVAGQQRIIDLNARLHLDGRTVTFRATPLGEVPLEAGDRVTVRCDAVTGRVMELWKQQRSPPP